MSVWRRTCPLLVMLLLGGAGLPELGCQLLELGHVRHCFNLIATAKTCSTADKRGAAAVLYKQRWCLRLRDTVQLVPLRLRGPHADDPFAQLCSYSGQNSPLAA